VTASLPRQYGVIGNASTCPCRFRAPRMNREGRPAEGQDTDQDWPPYSGRAPWVDSRPRCAGSPHPFPSRGEKAAITIAESRTAGTLRREATARPRETGCPCLGGGGSNRLGHLGHVPRAGHRTSCPPRTHPAVPHTIEPAIVADSVSQLPHPKNSRRCAAWAACRCPEPETRRFAAATPSRDTCTKARASKSRCHLSSSALNVCRPDEVSTRGHGSCRSSRARHGGAPWQTSTRTAA